MLIFKEMIKEIKDDIFLSQPKKKTILFKCLQSGCNIGPTVKYYNHALRVSAQSYTFIIVPTWTVDVFL